MDELIGSAADVVSIIVDDSQDKECIEKLKSDFNIEAELIRQGNIEFPRNELDLYPINKALIEKGIKVSSISSRSRTLEEYFVQLTGESQDVF